MRQAVGHAGDLASASAHRQPLRLRAIAAAKAGSRRWGKAHMKLLAGNSNAPLARSISDYLEMPLTDASVRRFADEEVFVEINENVRGEDVFVIQSTSYPANDNLMELLICIDALRRASAKRITAVLPYFGYARQDRKPGPRTPISAKLVANLITTAGANRVLSIDLHAGQIQGFFDIPTDNLFASPVIATDIQARLGNRELLVVSPDVGGVVRARGLAKRLNNAPLAIVDKRRERAGESEVMNIIGDVDGRTCILIDDIVDSGGTLCNAAAALKQQGAVEVFAYCTHGVLSGGAAARVAKSELTSWSSPTFDLDRRARSQGQQDPPPDHRAPAGRGDPPDCRRELASPACSTRHAPAVEMAALVLVGRGSPLGSRARQLRATCERRPQSSGQRAELDDAWRAGRAARPARPGGRGGRRRSTAARPADRQRRHQPSHGRQRAEDARGLGGDIRGQRDFALSARQGVSSRRERRPRQGGRHQSGWAGSTTKLGRIPRLPARRRRRSTSAWRNLALEVRRTRRSRGGAHPGWVQTRMGGARRRHHAGGKHRRHARG